MLFKALDVIINGRSTTITHSETFFVAKVTPNSHGSLKFFAAMQQRNFNFQAFVFHGLLAFCNTLEFNIRVAGVA